MYKKIINSLLVSSSIMSFCFGAVVNAEEEGTQFPLTEETVEFDVFVTKGAQNSDIDWNESLWLWDTYEEMTNVKMNWNQIANESGAEQRNLAIVSGDLPDIFYTAGFQGSEIYRYGQQGVIMPLNDLIENHAPNLMALFEKYPGLRESITFPDGNIYAVPRLFDPEFLSLRIGPFPWVLKSVKETVGSELPTNVDELYDFLVKIKESDADVIPMGAVNLNHIENYLAGSFEVMKNGNANGPIQINEDGNVEFYATSDNYKALLEYMNKLYSEGLIDQNVFSIQWGQYVANKEDKAYGVHLFWGPGLAKADEFGEEYEVMLPVEGPTGVSDYVVLSPIVADIGSYILTSDNENPEIAIEWIDYFYGDEGSELYFLGKEGETYSITDEGPRYVPEVEENIKGYFSWLGNGLAIVRQDAFVGGENSKVTKAAAAAYEEYVKDNVLSGFSYTQEENDFLLSNGVDIEKYYKEMRDGFISGNVSFDRWDEYVKTLESMGLEKYIEIKQAGYDRLTQNN